MGPGDNGEGGLIPGLTQALRSQQGAVSTLRSQTRTYNDINILDLFPSLSRACTHVHSRAHVLVSTGTGVRSPLRSGLPHLLGGPWDPEQVLQSP